MRIDNRPKERNVIYRWRIHRTTTKNSMIFSTLALTRGARITT